MYPPCRVYDAANGTGNRRCAGFSGRLLGREWSPTPLIRLISRLQDRGLRRLPRVSRASAPVASRYPPAYPPATPVDRGAVQMKVGEAVAEIMKREGIEILCGYPVNHLLEYAAAADIRPDHRAPGAHRPAHGGRDLARDVGQEDRRLLHAARPGQRERLWRRRAVLQRVRAAAGDPAGLSAPHRRHRSELQRLTRDARRVEDRRARDRARRDRQHHAPRVQQPAQRPQRPGDRRNSDRHLERGNRRSRLHAGRPCAATAPTRRMCARPRRRSSRRSGR